MDKKFVSLENKNCNNWRGTRGITPPLPTPQMMTGRRSMHVWRSWMRETGCWEEVTCPPSSLLCPRTSLFPPLSPHPLLPLSLHSAPRTRREATWPSLWLTSSSTQILPSQRWAQLSRTDPASHRQHHPVRLCLQV